MTNSDGTHLQTTPKKGENDKIAQEELPKKTKKKKGQHFVLFSSTKTGPKTKTAEKTLPDHTQTRLI